MDRPAAETSSDLAIASRPRPSSPVPGHSPQPVPALQRSVSPSVASTETEEESLQRLPTTEPKRPLAVQFRRKLIENLYLKSVILRQLKMKRKRKDKEEVLRRHKAVWKAVEALRRRKVSFRAALHRLRGAVRFKVAVNRPSTVEARYRIKTALRRLIRAWKRRRELTEKPKAGRLWHATETYRLGRKAKAKDLKKRAALVPPAKPNGHQALETVPGQKATA